MAGGDRTSDHGTMAERVARTRAAEAQRAGWHGTPNNPTPSSGLTLRDRREQGDHRPIEPCHVMVHADGRIGPGLLVEWLKPVELPWEGLVIHVRQVGGRWVEVREWVRGAAIVKVDTAQPGGVVRREDDTG